MATQLYDLLGQKYAFGRGSTSLTLSTNPCAYGFAYGTSGSPSLVVGDKNGDFSNGDLVLVHETRDSATSSPNWEVNRIESGAGTGTFTLKNPLARNYYCDTANRAARRAQVVRVPEYANVTLNSFTGAAWRSTDYYNNYGWGGIVSFAVRGVLDLSGILNMNGANGWSTGQDHNTSNGSDFAMHGSTLGGGFRGGWNTTDGNTASRGEGCLNVNWVSEEKFNGSSSGGGGASGGGNGGAGGANAGNGSDSSSAYGGVVCGSEDLLSAFFGGGGGGGRGNNGNDTASSGGNGGGLVIIWARRIIWSSGGIQAIGGSSSGSVWSAEGYGGGGAGGSILLNVETASLDSNKILAYGGGPAVGGGAGRIRINYGNSLIGSWSTNPAASTVRDSKLRIPGGMMQIM